MHWEEEMRSLASTQESCVAKFQLSWLGIGSDEWWRARRNGRWEVISGRVLRLSGAAESDAARAMGSVLDASPGAILHGRSALGWWGFRGYNLRSIEVARQRNVRSKYATLARVHVLRDLRIRDVTVHRGVPTETVIRAIWAEAAGYAPERLREVGLQKIGRLVDQAHRLQLLTWQALHDSVEELRDRGRAGTVIMRMVAAERPIGSSPTESGNEDRFELVMKAAARAPLRRQVWTGGEDVVGRCDFRDSDLPLVVEVNSLTYHTTPSDRAADERRYARLNAEGFTVAVVWDIDLWASPTGVCGTVDAARADARASTRGVIHSPSCPWPNARLALPPRS